MRAIVHHRYGSPDVLACEEIERPTPGDDEVLIRVRAASVNPADWHLMEGKPSLARVLFGFGLFKPKNPRLGGDVAGEVEAVGKNVTGFKPGNRVFGVGRGAFADYVCTSESRLAAMPKNASFEQAAAVPIAGVTASQGLRDKGQIRAGQKVLINGAAGGVGTFAVQIAKAFGADVTCVCSARNVDMVRSIGADRVIDYSREDFTESGQRYDLIFDLVANRSLSAFKRILNPKGIYVGAGIGPGGSMIGFLARASLTAPVLSQVVSQKFVIFIARITKTDLAVMRDLIEAGKVTPVIERNYMLSEVPEAMRYLMTGHARAKLVIAVK